MHLGAHKTASTYLQTVFAANLPRLQAAGVDYVTLEEMRSSITPRVARSGLSLQSEVRALLERHGSHDRLILSDENLPGGSREIIDRAYYHAAHKRIGRLIKALAGHSVDIMLATRSYDAFVSSMYCECIRHGPFLTIGEYLSALDIDRLSWPKLVADLCDLVGEERVTLWRYEDFAGIEDHVLSAIAGGVAIEWKKPTATIRRSLSHKAVNALEALTPLLGREEIEALVEPVSEAMPKGPRYPGFCAFDEKAASALRRRYERDMAKLKSGLSSIKWIAPNSLVDRLKNAPVNWLSLNRRQTRP